MYKIKKIEIDYKLIPFWNFEDRSQCFVFIYFLWSNSSANVVYQFYSLYIEKNKSANVYFPCNSHLVTYYYCIGWPLDVQIK